METPSVLTIAHHAVAEEGEVAFQRVVGKDAQHERRQPLGRRHGGGAGAEKHHKRANAEVQWQPCRCAGPSVKAAGLSLHLQRRAISAMGVNII